MLGVIDDSLRRSMVLYCVLLIICGIMLRGEGFVVLVLVVGKLMEYQRYLNCQK